eukprot:SAG11_NODE_47235_length_130_cov_387.096774_1_plen_43_part_11
MKRTDSLSNDNKMILLKKAQECIMDRLKAKHKDVKAAPAAFDK